MNDFSITWSAHLPEGSTQVLIPGGLSAPDAVCNGVAVTGGAVRQITEATTGQTVLCVMPEAPDLAVRWSFTEAQGSYPEALFTPHPSRFTRTADALRAEVAGIAADQTGLARAVAIACATAERFTYGHPAARFNDGHDAIPALGCGLTEGSCVDINTYFLAALRAVGIEAGYVTGFFFPQEKQGRCEDGHCWVLTRIDGAVQTWDIAHHLKMGTRDIRPAPNPKPGFRAACFYGMVLDFPDLGLCAVKALIEPACLNGATVLRPVAPEIRLHRQPAGMPA